MNIPKYKRYFYRFMSFRDGKNYDLSHPFSDEELLSITPDEVAAFFNFLLFGSGNPSPDAKPIRRTSSLEFAKKAISMCLPQRNEHWSTKRQEGNPTQSDPVQDVTDIGKRLEARNQGIESKARRPLELQEFLQLLSNIRSSSLNDFHKYRLSALLTLQWQAIGRIDDMMKLQFPDIYANLRHKFVLSMKLRWSKNIKTERQLAEQILVRSRDQRLCPLLNFVVYMELMGRIHRPFHTTFVFDNPKGHAQARKLLSQ